MKRIPKTISAFLALTLIFSLFFTGCGKSNDKEQNKETTSRTEQSTQTGEEASFAELDLSMFTGGYSDTWEQILEKFKEKYPGVKVTTDFDPKNHERLRARLVAGNPPDVTLTTQADFDLFGAIANGQYRAMNDLFEDTVPGKDIKYKDMFKPEVLSMCTIDGNIMVAPSDTGFAGLFYNKTLFKEKGWEMPKTWDEFMALCEKIKAEGIAPFTYQGIYPEYMIWGYLNEAIAAYGGREAYLDALFVKKSGAWKSEPVKKAVQSIADMRDKGYILEGTTALNHTQAQMEFINNRAAFIPCGTWFENEMKDNLPEDFEIGFAPLPLTSPEGKQVVGTFQQFFGIPEKAKNYEAAKAWIQFCYSDIAQEIYAAHGMIPYLKEIVPTAVEKFPKSVQDAIKLSTGDNITYTENMTETFYPTLYKVIGDNITLLVLDEISVDKFCENVEKEAERIRNDDSIRKFDMQ